MLLSNKKIFTFTFLVYAVFANAHIHQRDHSNLKRLLRKRAPPQGDFSLVAGAGAAVPTSFPPSSASTASVTSTLLSSSTSLSASISTSHSLTVSSQSSTSTSSSASETSISASTSESSTSASSSTSLIASSTSTISTPSAIVVTKSEQAPVSSTPVMSPTSSSKGIVTLTQAVDASQSATVVPQASGNAATHKSNAVTALIVTASSVAAIAILWTVFRKWKLGHSSKFDERLQPIDWRPTSDEDGALPGYHRRHSGASSFHSAGHLPSSHGHGSSDGHSSPSSYALPNHDFTAGPAHLAPVGGYADLARGPSPQPQMNQARGATLTRPGYGGGSI